SPDYAVFDGMHTLDGSEDVPETDSYTSPNEKSRLAANGIPTRRFHYRALAIDLAQEAANFVPPRSQAFAALMCKSIQWSQQTPDQYRLSDVYERYVRQGAHVPWSAK